MAQEGPDRRLRRTGIFIHVAIGNFKAFLEYLKNDLAVVSYRNHKCDDMDLSGFQDFEEEAVDFGVELIQAAYQYRQGKLSDAGFLKVIGERNYSGVEMH